MVAITIPNVPPAMRDELAARAARSGQTLQEYLAAQLTELASRPRPADVLAAARARAMAADRHLDIDEVRAAKDADRR